MDDPKKYENTVDTFGDYGKVQYSLRTNPLYPKSVTSKTQTSENYERIYLNK